MTAPPGPTAATEGVTAAGALTPVGFRAAGVAVGLTRRAAGAAPPLDLALLVNDGPRDDAAGLVTRNLVKGAPVLWTEQVLRFGRLRAVLLNSGCANVCTGPEGFADVHAAVERTAAVLGVGAVDVAACSTGVFGERLPMPAFLSGVDAAAAALATGPAAALAAATAILTSDTVPKQAAAVRTGWSVGGFAKGAGMIAPNLATLLAVLTTDAVADAATLDAALRAATATTIDRLDVDGGCSTNDTVLLLSSGASGVHADPAELTEALTAVCADLTGQLLADAEGATKRVTIHVRGTATTEQAHTLARALARDTLVKTAFSGSYPAWDRAVACLGAAGVPLEPDRLTIAFNGVTLFRAGRPAADRGAADLSGRDITLEVDLPAGSATATVLTTDLSPRYVELNLAGPA